METFVKYKTVKVQQQKMECRVHSIHLSISTHKIHGMLHYFFIIRECASVPGSTFENLATNTLNIDNLTSVSWFSVIKDLWLRCIPFAVRLSKYNALGALLNVYK